MAISTHLDLTGDSNNWLDFKYIVIHHSWTGDTHICNTKAIDRYHKSLGWDCIGYHYTIEKIGAMVEICNGRPLDKVGAHAKGWNRKALGICVIGNFDLTPPDEEKITLLIYLINRLRYIFSIDIPDVIGHRECWEIEGKQPPKSCPGWAFSMNQIRKQLWKRSKDIEFYTNMWNKK